ncbi:MAG: hypothetical protein II969_11815 [Anaerolineaceae bacterium]|nr:hypothetical protein [Anaerolineaceae bacterium]
MKKSFLLFFVLAVLLAVFGIFAAAAESALFGEYELTSMNYGGTEMDPGAMGMSAVLTLNEDGTGSLTMNGAPNELPKWTDDGATVTLYNSSGDALACSYADGIITLEMGENYYWYFMHESVNPNAGKPASMLSKIFNDIDPMAGAHLSYEYHSDYLDSTSVFDVHAKDGAYFSLRTTRAGGYENVNANCFLDGTVYLLYPAEKRGSAATTVSLSMLNNNLLLLDDCYKAMQSRVLRKDFTVEERELDGKKFTVEVFPASGSTAESAFYFDETGKLAHILEGAPAAMPDLGQTFYTIHSFDDVVDVSLFDISGYTIE